MSNQLLLKHISLFLCSLSLHKEIRSFDTTKKQVEWVKSTTTTITMAESAANGQTNDNGNCQTINGNTFPSCGTFERPRKREIWYHVLRDDRIFQGRLCRSYQGLKDD